MKQLGHAITDAIARTAHISLMGRRPEQVRFVAVIGVIVTFAFTGIVGVFSLVGDFLTMFTDASSMHARLAIAIRLAAVAALLWCPLVAAKSVAPEAMLIQHLRLTVGDGRSISGYVIGAAVVFTTFAAGISGTYSWFLLSVIATLAWGFRTGTMLNDPSSEDVGRGRRRGRARAGCGRARLTRREPATRIRAGGRFSLSYARDSALVGGEVQR